MTSEDIKHQLNNNSPYPVPNKPYGFCGGSGTVVWHSLCPGRWCIESRGCWTWCWFDVDGQSVTHLCQHQHQSLTHLCQHQHHNHLHISVNTNITISYTSLSTPTSQSLTHLCQHQHQSLTYLCQQSLTHISVNTNTIVSYTSLSTPTPVTYTSLSTPTPWSVTHHCQYQHHNKLHISVNTNTTVSYTSLSTPTPQSVTQLRQHQHQQVSM